MGPGYELRGCSPSQGLLHSYELRNIKNVPFEPGSWHICPRAGMQRRAGASVWDVARYHTHLLKLLGHLFSCIFRSLSLPSGRVWQEQRKAVTVYRSLSLSFCHRRLSFIEIVPVGLAGNWWRALCPPWEGALTSD